MGADRAAAFVSRAKGLLTARALSAVEAALVATIYDPPRARAPWLLDRVLPAGAPRYYSLARWALVDALRAFGLGPGDRVLLPALICRDVLASVSVVGATPVFFPVTRQLTPAVAAGVLAPANAVLAVNYFGFPQPLDVFRAYADRTGAAVIEDNAHGLFSRDADGRVLGSRGDAGVFSFRKTIPVPDGGALVVNARGTVPAERPFVHDAAVRHSLKQGVRVIAARLGPARALRAVHAVRRLRGALTGVPVPPGEPDAETRIPGEPNPREWMRHPVHVADAVHEAIRRRSLYDVAGSLVARSDATPVFPALPRHVVPSGFPVFASPAQARALEGQLVREGLSLVSWPDLPAAVVPDAPDHYRELMVVPFQW